MKIQLYINLQPRHVLFKYEIKKNSIKNEAKYTKPDVRSVIFKNAKNYSFSMFPVEIIEIIFLHSRGSDIINFRLVCKTWNSIIARLSKDMNLWRTKCKDEIPAHFCRSILNKLYPNISWLDFRQSEDNRLIWLRIYQSWINWHGIKNTIISTEQFEPFFIRLPTVKVTCVTVSENLLAVGSSEGFIAFYDVDNSTKEPIFIADQMAYVTNVQFLRYDKLITALSTSSMNHVMVWDIQSKTASEEKQYGRLISTTHGCICVARKHQLRVLSKNNKSIYQFPELCGTIVALVADGDQASILTEMGYKVKVNLDDPDVACVKEYLEPPSERVCKYYLFGPCIGVCITRDGYLGISLNSGCWVMYEILSKLHGVPTCVLFYANVLVLGLDSGSVHMYHVESVESLANCDFSSENSKEIVVDNQAIVALDIMDRPYKQYLIAATCEKVNIIEMKHFD